MKDETLTIGVEGAELHVELTGPEGAPTIYYLHGGPGYNSHSFRELAGDALHGYRVIYADQRGSGRSYGSLPEELDPLDVLASDLQAVLEALEQQPAALLAHGFGAMIAVRAALTHTRSVSGLVLVNPWLSMPLLARDLNHRAAELAGAGPAGEPAGVSSPPADPAMEQLPPEALVDEAFSLINPKALFDDLMFPRPSSRLVLEHVDAEALLGPPPEEEPAGVWQLNLLGELEELAALGLPVILLSGQQDGTSYPSQVEEALTRLPNALVSLLETGHYPWLDDDAGFQAAVREALAAIAGAPL